MPDPEWKAEYVKATHGNPDDGRWYSGDNLNLAIGQGSVDVTPLQLAGAYPDSSRTAECATEPTLLLKVTKPFEPTKVLEAPKPVVAGRITIEPSWEATLMAGFEGVITDGTAAAPFDGFPQDKFPIGGKTGTAEVGDDPNNHPFPRTRSSWGSAPTRTPATSVWRCSSRRVTAAPTRPRWSATCSSLSPSRVTSPR